MIPSKNSRIYIKNVSGLLPAKPLTSCFTGNKERPAKWKIFAYETSRTSHLEGCRVNFPKLLEHPDILFERKRIGIVVYWCPKCHNSGYKPRMCKSSVESWLMTDFNAPSNNPPFLTLLPLIGSAIVIGKNIIKNDIKSAIARKRKELIHD